MFVKKKRFKNSLLHRGVGVWGVKGAIPTKQHKTLIGHKLNFP